MRFLTVAERELRAGARQKATHRIRWITALAFLGLLIWLMWLNNWRRGSEVFEMFSALTFIYCILVGTVRSADCLSSEKREGTMGLLFLTNLNGPEIISGKLCSSALAAAYGLFAIFPLLAVEMLNGGITLAHFWKTVLALTNAIFFSIAAAFLASSVCLKQFTAVALATGLAICFSAGLMGLAAITHEFTRTKSWANPLALFSPLYPFVAADGGRVFGRNYYWQSLLAVSGMSVLWLGLATWRVSSSWRDRPKSARSESRWSVLQAWERRSRSARNALRKRLLEINPFYWLGGPRLVSAPIFMLLILIVVIITSYLAAPFFGKVLRAGTFSPMVGHMFAWFWAVLGTHAMLLYYAGMWASRGLAEDKQTGALELVLSTPTSQRSILLGLWMAYGRKLIFPAIIVMLMSLFLIWQVGTMAILDLPGSIVPRGFTPWQVIWHALLDRPLGGVHIDWHITFMARVAMLALAMFVLIWLTLGWIGQWLGLRLKHPGFAPLASLTLVFVPPIVLFTCACYIADEFNLDRLPERLFLPIMMWVAVAIGVGHCAALSFWAARRLRNNFRTIVTSRFQPAPDRPWWRPTRRGLVRFGVAGLSTAAGLVLLVLCFYGYQNWKSRRAWSAFKKELIQKKESLDLAALLPAPVPSEKNFALTPAFRSWVTSETREDGVQTLFKNLEVTDLVTSQPALLTFGLDWTHQGFAPLDRFLGCVAPQTATTPLDFTSALLQALEPHKAAIEALVAASRLPFFQTYTNRDVQAVLAPGHEKEGLERFHMLLQIRACALLATNRASEAADDVLAGLHVVRLARQIQDTRSPMRTQILLMRSLQPVWEGIVQGSYTGAQLAAIQNELAGFNFLTDFTNTVRRVVLAHIEVWESCAQSQSARRQVLEGLEVPVVPAASEMQPRAWWLENCRQLYQAAEGTIGSVDVAGERVIFGGSWNDLNGLPVNEHTTFLLQQNSWPHPSPGNVSYAQTALNQGIIACALQRYWLARGKYPETLDELIPQYLSSIPKDVVRGRPMLYQNKGDGRFTLRGVGQDQVDGSSKTVSDDWLWSFPTNAPPSVVR